MIRGYLQNSTSIKATGSINILQGLIKIRLVESVESKSLIIKKNIFKHKYIYIYIYIYISFQKLTTANVSTEVHNTGAHI